MNKEELAKKREEIREHLAARLYYLKMPSGNWNMMINEHKEFWYDEAELLLQRLASYGIMLVDREARIAVSGLDEDGADFYYKTYPLEAEK